MQTAGRGPSPLPSTVLRSPEGPWERGRYRNVAEKWPLVDVRGESPSGGAVPAKNLSKSAKAHVPPRGCPLSGSAAS